MVGVVVDVVEVVEVVEVVDVVEVVEVVDVVVVVVTTTPAPVNRTVGEYSNWNASTVFIETILRRDSSGNELSARCRR